MNHHQHDDQCEDGADSTGPRINAVLAQAAALGSFATSTSGMKAVLDTGAVPPLCALLAAADPRAAAAAARTLRLLLQSGAVPPAVALAVV